MKRRISIGIVLALLLSMALFSVASAHAKLVSSDPDSGAKLTQAPAVIIGTPRDSVNKLYAQVPAAPSIPV